MLSVSLPDVYMDYFGRLCMCDSLDIASSDIFFHHWNRKARAHFHVLATLWDACRPFPCHVMSSCPLKCRKPRYGQEGRSAGRGLLSPLHWNERWPPRHKPPKSFGSFHPRCTPRWQGKRATDQTVPVTAMPPAGLPCSLFIGGVQLRLARLKGKLQAWHLTG